MKEEKRSEIIHDALYFLDEEMIEDVEKLRGYVDIEELEHGSSVDKQHISMKRQSDMRKRKGYWRKWTAWAASICVLFLGGWMMNKFFIPDIPEHHTEYGDMSGLENSDANEIVVNEESVDDESMDDQERPEGFPVNEAIDEAVDLENIKDAGESADTQSAPGVMKTGVTIPAMEVNLQKQEGIAADMIGFFIHEGRCYVQYDYIRKDADFVGECVGTVNGLIDEWTEADGYVDGAGTFTGNIYEVEGISPKFMLCTVWDDGVVETYINNNGITLRKGSDLVDERLHLRENLEHVSFQTDDAYSYTQNEPIELSDEHLELFTKFLDSFAENDFAYTETHFYYPFGGNEDNSHMYHLYFTTENGVQVRFTLMGDGYVCFPWLNGVCVQIDQEIYDDVVDVLEKNLR